MAAESVVDKDSKLWKTAEEVREAEVVEIIGDVPTWLNGNYFRAGPGKFDFDEDFSVNNWLDGYCILQKYKISGERRTVTFESRYLDSDAYKRALKAQRPVVTEFGTQAYPEAGKGFFSRVMSSILPEISDNTNMSLFCMGSCEHLFTSGESCFFHEIDKQSLDWLEKHDATKLFGVNLCTPHPLTDTRTGITYNVGSVVHVTGTKYNLVQIPPASAACPTPKDQLKKAKVLCSIPSSWNSYLSYNHSFGMTQNYLVFIEQPLLVSIAKVLGSGFKKGDSCKDWLEWKPEVRNHFYVVEKSSGRRLLKTLEVVSEQPFFFLHCINCHEDTELNQIVVDLSLFESPAMMDCQTLAALRSGVGQASFRLEDDNLPLQAAPARFIIPLNADSKESPTGKNLVITLPTTEINRNSPTAIRTGKTLVLTAEPVLLDKGLELPTINPRFLGLSNQHFYASGATTRGHFKNSVCKVTVQTKEVKIFRDSEHFILGEPIFAARRELDKENTDEDDGLVIVPVTDSRKGQADMLIFLDAKDMTEKGKAVFQNRVPPAIHGIFLPDK